MKISGKCIVSASALLACMYSISSCRSGSKDPSDNMEKASDVESGENDGVVSDDNFEAEMLAAIESMYDGIPEIDFDKEYAKLTRQGYKDIKISGKFYYSELDIMLYSSEKQQDSKKQKWDIVGNGRPVMFGFECAVEAGSPKLIFEGDLSGSGNDLFGLAVKLDPKTYKYQLCSLEEECESGILMPYSVGRPVIVDEEVFNKNGLTLNDVFVKDGDKLIVRSTENGKLIKNDFDGRWFSTDY